MLSDTTKRQTRFVQLFNLAKDTILKINKSVLRHTSLNFNLVKM